MLETTDCSALEDLAAFAEGRLRGEERERVIGHLAECADCREVFAGIVETAAELDAEDNPGVIRAMEPKRRRFRWPVRTAAAASVAVVVVGSVVLWQLEARQHPSNTTEWLAQMPSATQLAPHTWGGVRLRGSGGNGALLSQSAELGALLVDVSVAIEGRDHERTVDARNRMAAILEDAGFMDDDVAMLRSTPSPPRLPSLPRLPESERLGLRKSGLADLSQLEKRLRERFEPAYMELGMFAEEVQVAASVGNREFLESRRARRYLDWVLSRPDMALPLQNGDSARLPEPVVEALRTLRREGASREDVAAAAQQILDALTG